MTEISRLGNLVERVLGHLSDETYRDEPCESFERGSTEGKACFVEDPEERGEFEFRVQMILMRAPPGREQAFFRRLLELNQTLRGRAAFALDEKGVVSLLATRPVLDLDASEVVDLILWTSQQADRLDDLLLKEFGYEHAL